MERSQFLQIMRFVAAALVLCTHATFYYHERISASVPIWHFGEVGVPIFFVISGIVMVVSTQSLGNDAVGAKAFVLRRIIRIVPLWWVALSVKVVVSLLKPDVVNHNFFQVDYALKSYFFIPYFNELHAVVPLHGVGWTLLHEAFFYIVFSLAMLLGMRPAWAASTVIVGLWLAGHLVSIDNPFWAVATSQANLQFVIGMVVGSLLTYRDAGPRLRRRFAAGLGALALGLGVAGLHWSVHHVLPIVLIFGAATLLLAQTSMPRALNGVSRLGDSSYSLYLFHPFIAPAAILGLGKLLPALDPAPHIAFAILFTIAAAHAIHRVVEVPVVRFARDRLLGASRPRVAAHSSTG